MKLSIFCNAVTFGDSKEYLDEVLRRFELQEEFLGTEKVINTIEPLVSIWVITYQHRLYIEQCLDSLLDQQTNFPFEIVIGEDQSTDGTREICMEYARRNPERIRLFLRDRELSHMEANGKSRWFNGRWTHQACRGKYIAQCEGDDYWISPNRLQMQVDMLERDSGLGLVHGEAHAYIQATKDWHYNTHRRRGDVEPGDDLFLALLDGRYRIVTCTVMYRRAIYEQISTHDSYMISQQQCSIVGDIQMWLEMSRICIFGYSDEPLGVYRILDESASRSKNASHMLTYRLEGLWIMLHYTQCYNVCRKFRYGHVRTKTKALLALASRLGNTEVTEGLWALMENEGVEYSIFDRMYRLCARCRVGQILASLMWRIEMRIESCMLKTYINVCY